jgi:putative tricarboxylic transport membrane protein
MLDLGLLADGLVSIANPASLAMIFLGVLTGVIVGAIPGLTTTMAMALAVPATFFMPPLLGIPFLLGLYKGGIYGGSIPAILISTPGTGAAVATAIDGYPLTRKGKGKLALHTALYASVTADLLSDIVFILLIAQLVLLARHFGPPEYFAVFVFALIMISMAAGKSPAKGLLSAAFGLMLSLVGTDTAGQWRYTFGQLDLVSGFSFVPLLIGLFAFSVIIESIVHGPDDGPRLQKGVSGERLTWPVMKSLAGLARNTAAPTRSCGCCTRFKARPPSAALGFSGELVARLGGQEFGTEGDAFFLVFSSASAAVAPL